MLYCNSRQGVEGRRPVLKNAKLTKTFNLSKSILTNMTNISGGNSDMGKNQKRTQIVAAFSAMILAAQVTGTGSSVLFAVKNAVADAVYEYEFGKEDPKRFNTSSSNLAEAAPSVSSLVHNSRYADYMKLDCIDVSRYQKSINWDAVAADGVQQAIIRMGYRGYGNEGTLVTDQYFRTNLEEATRVGLDVGLYFYTQATTVAEAIEEANFVLDGLNGYPLSLPIYYDIEKVEGATGRMDKANLTTEQRTQLCEAFCSTIEAAGYRAGVYANKSWLTNYLYADRLSAKYSIWLAHYTTSTSYSGDYDVWQFTASGSVAGITGGVDRSVCYSRKVNIIPDTLTLSGADAFVSPEYYGDGRLTFTSNDNNIAVVDNSGKITAVGAGETDILLTSSNGSSDFVHVVVTDADAPAFNPAPTEEPSEITPEPTEAPTEEPTLDPSILLTLPTEVVTEPCAVIVIDTTEPTEFTLEPTEEPTEEPTMENPAVPTEEPTEPAELITPPAPTDPIEKALKYATMLFNQLGETGISVAGTNASVRSADNNIIAIDENGSLEAVGVGKTELIAEDFNGNVTVCNVIVTNSENSFLAGDSNLDGVVDSLDASVILNYSASIGTGSDDYYLTDAHLSLLDVNQDGRVDSVDACAVLLYSALNGSGQLPE
ncbi:MAG TPA: hypothetical protein DCO72_10260 [Ruminococcus sp.]|nr:hypothetical protein [Ruminococcus sp.]